MPNTLASSAISSLGFAIFLVINATQVWGGIFPFLPLGFQTSSVTFSFYLARSTAFVVALAASTLGSYWLPREGRRMLVVLATVLVAAGSAGIIAVMYAPAFTLQLVLLGGVSLGAGTAAFFMLWQRYFSSITPEECNMQLMVGTALSALLYFALYLVPVALTAFLVPAVLLPVSALCLVLSVRRMDFEQPMFQDVPRERPSVYRRLLHDARSSAAGAAALGFACGLARGVALHDPSIGEVVNIASMAGSLLAAGWLLGLSRFRSVRFSMNGMFRWMYPLIITGLLLFPFFQTRGLSLFAGAMYLAFSVMTLVMMMQSAQTSRDRGTSPVFVYGFLSTALYGAQDAGFMLGWNAQGIDVLGLGQTAFLSLLAAYVLGMAFFFMVRSSSGGAPRREDQVEIIRLHADARLGEELRGDSGRTRTARKAQQLLGESSQHLTDRLSKQCVVARMRYGLSLREAEVMELIARNKTVAAIAQELFVSENTVRTHSKHIYSKMEVHSKQELSALLGGIEV